MVVDFWLVGVQVLVNNFFYFCIYICVCVCFVGFFFMGYFLVQGVFDFLDNFNDILKYFVEMYV